jgi:hypothetical protein
MQIEINKIFKEFGIFGSLLPPLGLFSQKQILFHISNSNTLVLANREIF